MLSPAQLLIVTCDVNESFDPDDEALTWPVPHDSASLSSHARFACRTSCGPQISSRLVSTRFRSAAQPQTDLKSRCFLLSRPNIETMAQRTAVTFVSDLSGRLIDGDGATVQFGLDGALYEIDLSSEEQKALRDALVPYIGAGRKISAARRRDPANAQSDGSASSREIRAWALENGFDVPARGRIPAAAAEAYRVVH